MGAYDVSTDGPAFEDLRAALAAMRELSERESVHLVELAKAYQKLAGAMVEVAGSAGRPSLRFDAVVRSLDLTTPKSALRSFLGG